MNYTKNKTPNANQARLLHVKPISSATKEAVKKHTGHEFPDEVWGKFRVKEAIYPNKHTRGEQCIAFPLDNGGFHVCRYKRPKNDNRWIYAGGGKPQPWGCFIDGKTQTLILEGEWDVLAAYQAGFRNCVTWGSASSINRNNVPLKIFKNALVNVVFDVNDVEKVNGESFGEHHAKRVCKILLDAGAKTRNIRLPLETEGGDVEEYLQEHTKEDLIKVIRETPFLEPTRINATLEELKAKFRELLEIKDDHAIDVIAGTYIANRIPGDPVWLLLVAPPSTMKTELVSSLRDMDDVIFLASMTPQTLISGRTVKGKNQSLLMRPDFQKQLKIIAMKDFTTVLSMRSEPQIEILAQLREVYDGQYSKAFGTNTGKSTNIVDWEGKIGFIGGVTPVIDKHLALHNLLGERFVYYRMQSDDRTRISRKARSLAGKEKTPRTDLRKMMSGFLSKFEPNHEPLPISEELDQRLASLADFCTTARTAVSRDHYDKSVQYLPEPEGPARLTKQIYLLGSGVGIVNRKKEIDAEVYETIKKIARDSIPAARKLVLEKMWKDDVKGDRCRDTVWIAEMVNLPSQTVRLILEDLMLLRLVDRFRPSGDDSGEDEDFDYKQKREPGRVPYRWRLSEQAEFLMEVSQVFNGNLDVL